MRILWLVLPISQFLPRSRIVLPYFVLLFSTDWVTYKTQKSLLMVLEARGPRWRCHTQVSGLVKVVLCFQRSTWSTIPSVEECRVLVIFLRLTS